MRLGTNETGTKWTFFILTKVGTNEMRGGIDFLSFNEGTNQTGTIETGDQWTSFILTRSTETVWPNLPVQPLKDQQRQPLYLSV